MATINLSATDKDGSLQGTGTIAISVPAGGTISLGGTDADGNISVNIHAEKPFTIATQKFTIAGDLTDALNNGQLGTDLTLTYTPSDLATFSLTHDFGANSTGFEPNPPFDGCSAESWSSRYSRARGRFHIANRCKRRPSESPKSNTG